MKITRKAMAIILTLALLISCTTVYSFATTERSWYICRNGNCRPKAPDGYEEISDLGAYFIDKKLSDSSDDKRLYLTFDAGYENGNIEKILNTLKEENVPAAFFLLDNIILKNTDLVKRMAAEGHLVCNHTKNHKNLSSSSPADIEKDLSALESIYESATGNQMATFFRFPEGKYSREAVEAVNELGYKTVFWSFGYDDWDNARQPSAEAAVKKILGNTHNGAVILLHPTSSTNAEILKGLIGQWRNMGYSFGTLEELVRDD